MQEFCGECAGVLLAGVAHCGAHAVAQHPQEDPPSPQQAGVCCPGGFFWVLLMALAARGTRCSALSSVQIAIGLARGMHGTFQAFLGPPHQMTH